jgi:hypothetical protein
VLLLCLLFTLTCRCCRLPASVLRFKLLYHQIADALLQQYDPNLLLLPACLCITACTAVSADR